MGHRKHPAPGPGFGKHCCQFLIACLSVTGLLAYLIEWAGIVNGMGMKLASKSNGMLKLAHKLNACSVMFWSQVLPVALQILINTFNGYNRG
eukprot:1157969-Pelagomonas_calceolata.AAC.1